MAIVAATERGELALVSLGKPVPLAEADCDTPVLTDDPPERSSTILSWTLLQSGLVVAASAVPSLLASRYGTAAGRRAAVGLALALGTQYGFVVRAVRQAGPQVRGPNAADVLTLSRATGASILAAVVCSGVRDRSGLAGQMAWAALLWGETVSDWFDGSLARRRGPTLLGATLDMESDSWLTLWAALASVAWGDLPPVVALAPALRYPVYQQAGPPFGSVSRSWWARGAGQAQMAVLTLALCPWPVHSLRGVARKTAAGVAAVSLVSLAMQRASHRRSPQSRAE